MKQRLIFLMLLCLAHLIARSQNVGFASYKNESAKKIVSPALLAHQLTAGSVTEKQKVAAIFNWITNNIDYKLPSLAVARRAPVLSRFIQEDTGALKPLNERVSERVLLEREAFCEGYARLFNTLCTYAGIQSEVITGYVRPNVNMIGKKFQSNHTWNAVRIDSTWHLLDPTWASGYISYYGDRFVRHYNEYYFLTPPSLFIRSHYPEDLQWTLLKDPPTLKEFEASPFKQMGYVTRHIQSAKPMGGIIEASIGDTLYFEIEAKELSDDLRVVDVSAVDSVYLTDVKWWEYPKPATLQYGNRITVSYVVNNASVQWLHVVYMHAVILRYHLKIKEHALLPGSVNSP